MNQTCWLIQDDITRKNVGIALSLEHAKYLVAAMSRTLVHELEVSVNNGFNVSVFRDEGKQLVAILVQCQLEAVATHSLEGAP